MLPSQSVMMWTGLFPPTVILWRNMHLCSANHSCKPHKPSSIVSLSFPFPLFPVAWLEWSCWQQWDRIHSRYCSKVLVEKHSASSPSRQPVTVWSLHLTSSHEAPTWRACSVWRRFTSDSTGSLRRIRPPCCQKMWQSLSCSVSHKTHRRLFTWASCMKDLCTMLQRMLSRIHIK